MSRQYWSEAISWFTSSHTAIANTTSELAVLPPVTFSGNYFQDGRVVRLRGFGGYGTTGTPTLTFTLRWGGTTGTQLSKSGAIVTPSGAGGGASMTALWAVEIIIQTRTNGASGTLMTNGEISLYTTGTAAGVGYPMASGQTGGTTPVAVTATLDVDTSLVLTAAWGTANAANSIQGHEYVVESLN